MLITLTLYSTHHFVCSTSDHVLTVNFIPDFTQSVSTTITDISWCSSYQWRLGTSVGPSQSKSGKVIRYRPGVAQRVGRGIALLFHDCGTRRGWRSAARPGRTLSLGKTGYPFYRRVGGQQGRSGRAENLVSTEIRFLTVKPVFSRYTDWATGPTSQNQ